MYVFQGVFATAMTQPFDVMKTRLMNAKEGEYKVRPLSLFFLHALL